MRATDIIIKKRGTFITDENGNRSLQGSQPNTKEEIQFMINGCVDGTIPEYQMSAWLMAIFFNGMSFEETGYLTEIMLHSGDVIDFHAPDANNKPANPDTIYVDKHSTGGVGDKLSLPLAAIVSACGLKDPMMSGRALGHTGGTLDKLESINGFSTQLTAEKFMEVVNEHGYAMIGQTAKIAPADKILYALRDVTGTVESVPLITASILSKKIAEGSDGLVFDVKYGSGAFMKSKADAEILASFLVNTSKAMGKKAAALITNMNTPLGNKIGNFLEVEETIECLDPKNFETTLDSDSGIKDGLKTVMEITYALGAQMLVMANLADSVEDGISKCKEAVKSGAALKKFLENVQVQGGNPDELLSQIGTRRSPHKTELKAVKDGYIYIDAYKTGVAGVTLGVGRNKTTDSVCGDAGMILSKHSGDFVHKGELIMEIYGKDDACLEPALKMLENAVSYSDSKPEEIPLIYKII